MMRLRALPLHVCWAVCTAAACALRTGWAAAQTAAHTGQQNHPGWGPASLGLGQLPL